MCIAPRAYLIRIATDDDLVRALLVLVAIVLLFPLVTMLFGWSMMGMWGGGHMWGGTGASWGGLVMLLVLQVLLLGGGYLLYQSSSPRSGSKTDAALAELRLAYARGELSDEEFETRRDRLHPA